MLIRTGRMAAWDHPERFVRDGPGINLRAAQWLVEATARCWSARIRLPSSTSPATDVLGHICRCTLPARRAGRADDGDRVLEELARD
jgi:kynurenine formamidase